jgi:predicted ferric reductase
VRTDDSARQTWALRVVLIGALLVLVGAATPQGAAVADSVQYFLSFYVGVFTLLAMTAAVVFGLLATERLILGIRHRVFAQGVHRAASLLSVTFLIAHFLVKVLGGLAAPAQIVVPSTSPVGLGAFALDLMIVIVITGLMRARFAFGERPWVWRSMHALAYLSWPVAIAHGLTAGRPAAPWVTLSYVLCGGFVALALVTRMIVVVRPRELRRAGDPIGTARPLRERRGAGDARRVAADARAAAEERAADTEVMR